MAISYVVVYLVRARQFVVIPDTWVQDLNKAKLKNYGANSNQDFLSFWSATNGEPNIQVQPNFNAMLDCNFHDTIGEVCYICRIKKFFGELILFSTSFFSILKTVL